jgi:hypothetical protein
MKKHATILGIFIAVLMGIFLANIPVQAQGLTTAAMNGTITDAKGDPLPGANILVVHVPSGTQYGTTSRLDGKYNIQGLRPGGPYKVTASYVGYQSQELEEGYLELGQNLTADFILPESAIEFGEVTVTAERDAIFSSSRTGATQHVSRKQVDDVPTISRRFQDFSKLSPLFSGTNLQAAGRSNRYNNIQIDGTQYNDLFGLGSSGTPGGQAATNPISLDAIQEFQVVIAPYDVRFNSFTGGGINAITRAGTNKWTGSAYFYGRNQDLVGKSPTDRDQVKFEEFEEYQVGFRVGGPILEDKIFFFVNGELTQDTRPSENVSLSARASNDSLARQMASILQERWGINPGTYLTSDIDRPSNKIFARLDFNLSRDHKLTLRHNFVDASNDILANRSATNRLAFDSYAYRFNSMTNSTVAQLNSKFGDKMANELIIGYTSIRDDRSGRDGVDIPEIEVRESGLTMTAGPDRFSSANELDQDILEVTNNFSYFAGDHILTVGTHNEFFSFRNLFIRSFFGYYVFNSLADLDAGTVADYQRAFSRDPNDPKKSAEFSVAQFGFYAQDEWTVSSRLKLTFGIRVDIPTFPETPERNDSVTAYFPGYSTEDVPSGNLLWSPRFGFNYDASGDRTTQIRGGLGMFTGRIPYVWMSNNYGNTGTLYAEVRGSGVDFITDVNNLPGPGDFGLSANFRSEVNLVDPNFKMPQLLRFNLGVDQQLPLGIIGTFEFLYSHAINDLIYTKVNLNPQSDEDPDDGRPVFGGTNSGGGNFFDMLYLTNTSLGYQYNFVAQFQRNVARGLGFNAGYVFGRAYDENSVTSSQARSQMRYNPIDGNPNAPRLTTSLYEVAHRIYASVSYTAEFFQNAPTTFSVFYNGQSGQPFSYIVRGDMNNDGFDFNDLFYIPRNSSEILLGTISGGAYVPASDADYEMLFSFIENDPYLSQNKGKIALRNGARNPWTDVFDIRIAQDIPIYGTHRIQLTFDILNVLNLLDNTLGWQESVFSTYNIVNYRGRVGGRAVYSLDTGGQSDPFAPDNINSRWAMQFGVRYAF